MSTGRPFVRERGILPARRHAVRADDKAELMAIADQLQDVPRESTATIQDMLFHNHRMSRGLRAAAERIEVVDDTGRKVLERSWQAPPPPVRDHVREITSAKGWRVRVVERPTRQLEMAL